MPKHRPTAQSPQSCWILACGGTGGHLFPGIATYQEYERAGLCPVLAVSYKSIDQTILSHYPTYRYTRLQGALWHGNWFKRGLGCFTLLKDTLRAIFWMKKHNAQGVVGFGGFTMVPWVLAAFCLRKKILLHEANVVPGKATRLLAPLADRIYGPSNQILKSNKLEPLGIPLRDGLHPQDPEGARQSYEIPDYGEVLLIMGGSQGAHALTQWASQSFEELARMGWHVIALSGNIAHEEKRTAFGPDNRIYNLVIKPFEHHMAELLSIVDFAIARSGAGTIAEFIHFGIPSILIPYPYAAQDHQTVNAEWITNLGGAKWLAEDQLMNLMDCFIQSSEKQERERTQQALKLQANRNPRRVLLQAAGMLSGP